MQGRNSNKRDTTARKPLPSRCTLAPWEPAQPPGYQRLPQVPEYAEQVIKLIEIFYDTYQLY